MVGFQFQMMMLLDEGTIQPHIDFLVIAGGGGGGAPAAG
jgi:hypothetical protein